MTTFSDEFSSNFGTFIDYLVKIKIKSFVIMKTTVSQSFKLPILPYHYKITKIFQEVTLHSKQESRKSYEHHKRE